MTDDNNSPLTSDDIQEQRRQQMKDAILRHARDIMRERGVGGMSLGEVARRLGVKTPSLYEYFPNKKAVYDAIFRAGYEQFGEEMNTVLKGLEEESMRAWFSTAMRGYMRFAVDNPELYQLMFERPIPGFVPSEESLKVSFGVLNQSYGVFTLGAIQHGFDLPDDLTMTQAHDLFLALQHGIVALHLANEPELPPEEGRFGGLIDAAVEVLMRAWAPEETHTKDERSTS